MNTATDPTELPAVPCSPALAPTPETDEFIMCAVRTDHNWRTFARKLERDRDRFRQWNEEGKINGARCAEERDRLQDAIRTLRDAKGDAANQDAYEEMIALLPENVKDQATDGARDQ